MAKTTKRVSRKAKARVNRVTHFRELDKLPSPPPDVGEIGHYRGLKVYSSDGARYGRATGAEQACDLSGCTGTRPTVVWPDGDVSYPCIKGMEWYRDGWKIT